MKILAKPAFSNKSRNPYNYQLYSHLEQLNEVEVEEFTPGKALVNHYDIFHIHWPEVMISDNSFVRSFLTVSAFLLLLRWMKFRGIHIIWTVHNLRSHNYVQKGEREKKYENWYMNKLSKLVDGVIGLSEASLEEAAKIYPVLSEKQQFVTPHGHYKNVYPDTANRTDARHRIGLGVEQFLIGYFGQIRPYKNVSQLIEVYKEMDKEDCSLWIAGNPVNEQLENNIQRLAEDSGRIKLTLQFISNKELQYVFRAIDLLVIPYRNVLNSGSVLLSLSFDTPVLVPDLGSMKELKQNVGAEWVKTYNGELKARDLMQAIAAVKEEKPKECNKIDRFGWDRIAKETFEAYSELFKN